MSCTGGCEYVQEEQEKCEYEMAQVHADMLTCGAGIHAAFEPQRDIHRLGLARPGPSCWF